MDVAKGGGSGPPNAHLKKYMGEKQAKKMGSDPLVIIISWKEEFLVNHK